MKHPYDSSDQSKRSILITLVFVIIFTFTNLVIFSIAHEGGKVEDQNHSQQDEGEIKSEARINLPKELFLLNDVAKHVLLEYWWLLLAAQLIVLIKLVMLRQPCSEVVACGLSVIAFLLLHMIVVVRFAALELKRLARELRLRIIQEREKSHARKPSKEYSRRMNGSGKMRKDHR